MTAADRDMAAYEDLAAAVRSGDLTVDQAREEIGLPPAVQPVPARSLGEALQADRAATLMRLQELLAAILPTAVIEPDAPGMRLRVATVGDRHVEILLMLTDWRVVEWPVDDPSGYGRHWHYDTAAALEAGLLIWSHYGYADTGHGGEPTGWVKAHCQCRHSVHRPGCRHDPARATP